MYEPVTVDFRQNTPHLKYLINKIESVQKNFFSKLPGLWDISYPKRLQLLNLQSLEYRRIFQDLMLCYQILHGRCDTTIIASCFVHRSDDSTRGNQLRLYKCHCTVDVTKHYLLTELSMYGTVFQTLLSWLLACYLFVVSWLNSI